MKKSKYASTSGIWQSFLMADIMLVLAYIFRAETPLLILLLFMAGACFAVCVLCCICWYHLKQVDRQYEKGYLQRMRKNRRD